MSQTASPISSPTFNTSTYQAYAHQFQEGYVTVGLLGGLYGVLVILSLVSGYGLLTRHSGPGRIQLTALLLCLTIFALFTSTTVYMTSLWSYSSPIEFPNVPQPILRDSIRTARLQACAAPATLTINVILGDAIVCWRVCVVWHRNSPVKAILGIFLLATFILGVVDTTQSCQPQTPSDSFTPERPTVGITACVLSLSTNLLATLLVAYKAWESRRRLKQFLTVVRPRSSHVQKVLSLLIESGALYSALWALIVAFQVSEYVRLDGSSGVSPSESRFLGILNVVVNGALVPLIAIYPTVIIVLIALNRSQIEKGLTQHLESVQTPHLVVNVETSTIRRRDGHSLELVTVDGQVLRCENDHCEPEDVRGRTSEERKVEKAI